MPIESIFYSHEREATFHLQVVQAGETGSWSDLSHDPKHFIVASCSESDFGAQVYIVEEGVDAISCDSENPNKFSVVLSEENLQEYLYPGFSYEVEIVDYEGELGRLVLRHTTDDGLVQSYN